MTLYVPPLDRLEALLGVKLGGSDDGEVRIHKDVLRTLVMAALHATDFDQEHYLRQNPDLAAAWERGEIPDLKLHYIESGYFERRSAAPLEIDESWYRDQNKDVDLAMHEGRIGSASQHFRDRGEAEWRAPRPELAAWFRIWRQLYAAR